MADGTRAPLLRAVTFAPMGETVPPASKSQPASERDDEPHESITAPPPAPNFEGTRSRATPAPSLTSRTDQHFRAALAAGSRTDCSLSELSRIVADLSGGLSGAKLANEQLLRELSALGATLGGANEQQLGLEQRIAELEQDLARASQDAERDRRFLTEQHDAFLAALLEEHEEALRERAQEDAALAASAEIADLTQKLARAEAGRQRAESEAERTRDMLSQAQTQRDEAQARAEKLERERDELRAEASQLRAGLGASRRTSTAPPPAVAARPPSHHPPPALALDAVELDSTLRTRAPTLRPPSAVPRLAPPPRELVGAVHPPRQPAAPPIFGPSPTSGWTPLPPSAPEPSPPARLAVLSAASLPPGSPSQPALKQKPDPTTRPLIDYSLGEDGVLTETLEGARFPSRPPRK